MNIDDNTIITRNMLDKLNIQYRTQQEEIQSKLRMVLNGVPFGEIAYDPAYYFPQDRKHNPFYVSTLLCVVDYEQGIIRYREECTNTSKEKSVLFLEVEGYCRKEKKHD